MIWPQKVETNFVTGLLFLLFIPLAVHLAFSHLGFNPTDDGFILAGSRRILEGQVPHRDFISIRPPGSYVLHLPLVRFGGDSTFWLSRYVAWFQFACIAWCWVCIINQLLGTPFTPLQQFLCALIAFVFTSNFIPIMVWHTLDGLFISSVGLVLCIRPSLSLKMTGYALLGLAPLVKQNFVFIIPASLILLDDWRHIRLWLVTLIPGLLAGLTLGVLGALPDAVQQISSRTELFSVGVKRYLTQWGFPLGVVLGFSAMALAAGQIKLGALTIKPRVQRVVGMLMLYAVPLGVALAMSFKLFIGAPIFGVFGSALGATFYLLWRGQEQWKQVRAGLLVIVTAWVTSIATGGVHNSPIWVTGPLVVLLIAYSYIACRTLAPHDSLARVPVLLTGVVVIIALVSYSVARRKYIYRERPAPELTQALDGVFPGANRIKTNPNTYAFLVDLQGATTKTRGQPYAIIPDLAGYWAQSRQSNPLSIDWVQGKELNTEALYDRVIRDMESRRGHLVIIVQKVSTERLATGFEPLRTEGDYHAVVRYVRNHFTKSGETMFFELYE